MNCKFGGGWTIIHRACNVINRVIYSFPPGILSFDIYISGEVMKKSRQILLGVCGLASLSLTACGEGWVPVEYRGRVPYTEERTAGPGIEYVRAHMMPQKSVVIPAPMVTEMDDAEPIFNTKMEKAPSGK